ncbi:MAG: hypothetical protein ACYC27_21905 [Armatimonadota bacterium]
MGYKERLDKTFTRYGEDIMINGTVPAKGIFQILDQNRMNAYFDSVEQSYIDKPALIAMVPADVTASIGNTIVRDGRTYTVKKISSQKLVNTAVFRMLLLT